MLLLLLGALNNRSKVAGSYDDTAYDLGLLLRTGACLVYAGCLAGSVGVWSVLAGSAASGGCLACLG
jgi:hypothetical protein